MEEMLAGIPNYLIGWSAFLVGVGLLTILLIRFAVGNHRETDEIEESVHEDLRPKSATEIQKAMDKLMMQRSLKKKASLSIDDEGTLLLRLDKESILQGNKQKIKIFTGEDDMATARPLVSYALRDNHIGVGYQFDMEVTVLPPMR